MTTPCGCNGTSYWCGDPSHVRPAGAAGPAGEVDIDLSAPERPYIDFEPSDVDKLLAELYGREMVAMSRYESTIEHVNGEMARHYFNRGWSGSVSQAEFDECLTKMVESPDVKTRELRRHLDRAERYRQEMLDARTEAAPLHDEFDSRGGWPRAFLVTNSGGHVHSSMNCSTCFDSTRYHWVTEFSGKDEDEIVEAAGERACTVCYPSAPAETLSRPTQMFTPDEIEKAKAREARAQAKIEREAKAIANAATPDGSVLVVSTGLNYPEKFKTERAASQWAVQHLVYANHNSSPDPNYKATHYAAVSEVATSIAAKRGVDVSDVMAEFEKKAAAKAKRDGWTS